MKRPTAGIFLPWGLGKTAGSEASSAEKPWRPEAETGFRRDVGAESPGTRAKGGKDGGGAAAWDQRRSIDCVSMDLMEPGEPGGAWSRRVTRGSGCRLRQSDGICVSHGFLVLLVLFIYLALFFMNADTFWQPPSGPRSEGVIFASQILKSAIIIDNIS